LEKRLQQLNQLQQKIRNYGKENLHDILHFVTEGVELITGRPRSRIYLEDMTEGMLTCTHVRGEREADIRGTSLLFDPKQSLISRAFIEKKPLVGTSLRDNKGTVEQELAKKFGIRSSTVIPIVQEEAAIGVICVDSEKEGDTLSKEQLKVFNRFLEGIAPSINIARTYHQQILLGKQVDEVKKREAAFRMVRSAVKLVDKLCLASVLVPGEMLASPEAQPHLEILATYSRDPAHKNIYEDRSKISLREGDSLFSRLVCYETLRGVSCREEFAIPLYYPNVKKDLSQRRTMAERIGLSSLYTVPRYDLRSRRLICIVNYYTCERYEFSPFEKRLLENHAEMAERAIQEIGREHIEIRVLSEINQLLTEKEKDLPSFLGKVLSKVCELIGTDTGSIALVREKEGEKWLYVEDDQGKLLGAKSREWRKKYIPPFRVGAEDLDREERSLTGLVAFTRESHLLQDVEEEKRKGGFFREISAGVKSELGVPVLVDDRVIAVINVDSFTKSFFTEEHKRIIEIIARLVGRHIQDLQKIDELQQEVDRLKRDITYRDPKVSSYRLGTIIGNSPKSQEIIRHINNFVPFLHNRIFQWERSGLRESPLGLPSILISGETGSGKEFIFNHIYALLNELYQRDRGPTEELLVRKCNIAAYSGELTYSELFGHKKGAFTSAYSDRRGILEESDGGVVFLDEIGDADPKTQVQLLRFLDNGSFVRLGENQTRYAHVLLVAATNRDLLKMIRERGFREDLYYRLSELSLRIPPLRERREDIPDLAVHFLGQLYQTYKAPEDGGREVPYLDKEAKALLLSRDYTGNVRELRSILLRALFLRSQQRIGKKEILSAIQSIEASRNGEPMGALNEKAAYELFERIQKGEADFWEGVYRPYCDKEITREMVKLICSKARSEGGHSLPRLAVSLRACLSDFNHLPEEKKKFTSFKNFLYKTIRITQ
jgi:transcriptional regulator with GAF, ATPase, and Fis domain